MILVTMGARGALLVTKDELLHAVAPNQRAVQGVATGCGDAATAGWLWATRDGCSPGEMLRRAVACGTAKLGSPDPGELSHRHVSALLRRVKIETIPF